MFSLVAMLAGVTDTMDGSGSSEELQPDSSKASTEVHRFTARIIAGTRAPGRSPSWLVPQPKGRTDSPKLGVEPLCLGGAVLASELQQEAHAAEAHGALRGQEGHGCQLALAEVGLEIAGDVVLEGEDAPS